MNQDPRQFRTASKKALADAGLKQALGRLGTHFVQRRADAAERYGDWDALRDQGAAIRAHAIAHLDTLLETFETNVTKRGGKVHWARDAAEARAIVLRILQDNGAKTVTKGKSMVSEEIGLNPFLEANGIRPVETDLGEYIIQLRNEPPSHIIAPAFHLNKEDVETAFRAAHTTLDPARALGERTERVAEARAMLRAEFEAADVGITGANFLSAAEGACVLVTNEGNGDLTRLLPKTHIVLTGIEKVAADLDDVAVLLRLLTRSATGQDISSYVSLFSAPEPGKQFHIVLVDNGRSRLIGTEAEETLRCIRCAACLNHCPIYGAVGGHTYGAHLSRPHRRSTQSQPARRGRGEPSRQRIDVLRALRGSVPGENPAAAHHALLARRRIRERACPQGHGRGPAPVGFHGEAPGPLSSGTKLMTRLLKAISRGGTVRSFPLMQNWFAVRDFPAPEGKTFHEQWRARK